MALLRRFGPVPWLFLAFWLILMIGGRSRLLRDPGTFWHTRVGEKLLRDGFFVGDPFAFSNTDPRWVPHQWLGEVIMAALHHLGGFDAFVLTAATILATLFTLSTLRILRTGLHLVPTVLVVLLAFAASALQFHVRPLLMTMTVLMWITMRLTRYELGELRQRDLWWFVPVFVVWANMHGGHLGGVAMLGLAWIGWSAACVVGWPSPFASLRDSWGFLTLVVVCAGTAIVNPYGLELPRAWFLITGSPKIAELIEEHKRLDPTDLTAWPLFLFTGIVVFVLAGLRERPRVVWLLPLAWFVETILHVRHAPLFALTALVALATMWPRTRWAEWLRQHRADIHDPQRGKFASSWFAWLVPVLVYVSVLVAQWCGLVGWARFDSNRWPMELVPIIREYEPKSGEPNRLFNSCELGGFAIYYAPGFKVFFDDRLELYSEAFFVDVVQSEATDPAAAIERWQERFGTFDFALLTPRTPFDTILRTRSEWELLAETPSGAFYRRKR